MLKKLLSQIIVNIGIILVYALFGLFIPIMINVEGTNFLLFTWIISPIVAIILVSFILIRLNISKAKAYIIGAFVLNIIYICIYTWLESLKPRVSIEGDLFDFDFRGLVLIVFGIGQIIGLVFTFLYFSILKIKSNQ
ncbi:MAG TPA: hypothetical protein VIO64_02790 [Pseudobacteroides sp.]|uniref:hypothetical protein n=1 Tax=Pseudobacteroides sp. TaxID=1968840 RepID=UPI002F95DE11